MNRKLSGSMIVELLFSLIFAGLAVSIAMQLPVTLVKFWEKVLQRTHRDLDWGRLEKLLEDDFSAMTIPSESGFIARIKKKPNPLTSNQPASGDSSSVKDDEEDVSDATGPAGKRAPISSPAQAVYLKSNADGNLDLLFCFSTSTVPCFSEKRNRLTGLVYTLEKAQQNLLASELKKKVVNAEYSLVRYEIDNLLVKAPNFNLDKFLHKRVVVAPSVKSFKISFSFYEKDDEKGSATKEAKPPVKKVSDKWPTEGADQTLLPCEVIISGIIFVGEEEVAINQQISVLSSFRTIKENVKTTDVTTTNTDSKSLPPQTGAP